MRFTRVNEPSYSNEVDPTQDEDDDARADDDAPERQTEFLLSTGRLVEISHHVDTQDDHGQSETDEAMTGAEERPIAREVRTEEGELGCDEEHWKESQSWTKIFATQLTHCWSRL